MRNLFLAALLVLVGCGKSETDPSYPGNRMAARADTQGTGILTTSSGTDNLTAFWCDGGVSSTSSSTGLPVCTPALQIQPTDDAGDNAVIISGLLETGVSAGHTLNGIDGGSSTTTISVTEYSNHVVRFIGNPGYSDGGGAATLIFDLPAIAEGATGYSMLLDFTQVTMTGVAVLEFKIGSSSAYSCSSLGIGQYMYLIVSNGAIDQPTVGLITRP